MTKRTSIFERPRVTLISCTLKTDLLASPAPNNRNNLMANYLNHFNSDYIEKLLQDYRQNPDSVDPTWQFFFDGMAFGEEQKRAAGSLATQSTPDLDFELKVIEMIQGYRDMAYLIADVNPLNRAPKQHALLELKNFGLSDADLNRTTRLGRIVGLGDVPLKDIIQTLKTYYCSPASVEIGHIEDPKSRHWVQTLIESKFLLKPLDANYKKRTFAKLSAAENFERFIHKRFVGAKRFSLEGNDVVVPMLDYFIDKCSLAGADEVLIGMAHRGRLNVLANIFGKDLSAMFAEFLGNLETNTAPGDGDVKYHMGYSIDTKTFSGNDVHLSLAPNPSHLEAINPVVMGMARAKQKLKSDIDKNKTVTVLLHGDASFAGQGSIYELLNMSALKGYDVGGIIHIIVNNQIGFTTEPQDSRSTANATDVAKMLQIPIFRVNADEPEACLRCIDLAVEYRRAFKRDVVIDVVGYRRYGHNEGDEPGFTQPVMYQKINAHPTVRERYSKQLQSENFISANDADTLVNTIFADFDAALEIAKKTKFSPKMAAFGKRWEGFSAPPPEDNLFLPIKTGVEQNILQDIGTAITEAPAGFHVHPKIQRLIADRTDMFAGKRGLDWGAGEALAFGSLIKQGHAVRLAGQDVKRGTFSHRHAVFFYSETNTEYVSLNKFKNDSIDFEPVNSLLSEYAALGFEVGQSWANPAKLTLWEAQFGDFMNGAQIIIDQFITCSAFKWQRYSGLVMLLPHGYEGQGPEHSSGRIERFLQACAQNNIQVCNLTTPAQYFHVLRRQLLRAYRLPLIIMSPKSLLRLPQAVSSLADFSEGRFHEVLDDPDTELHNTAKRVVLCSGKIYYELLKGRAAAKNPNVAIVRVEQFYPFPQGILTTILSAYKNLEELVWCQEEPKTMGGWWFMNQHLLPTLGAKMQLRYAGRPEQASPAHGYMHLHQSEQEKIVQMALGEL